MAMRVQCSLLLTDDKLAEGLVRPLKNSKQLAPFVLKLLGAYYYDENIRSAIDSSTFEQDDGFMDSINQQFKETREAFQLLNYYTQSADATIASGIQQMKEVVSAEPDKFGTPIGVLKESPVDAMRDAINEGYEKRKQEDERISQLEECMVSLQSAMTSILNKIDSISSAPVVKNEPVVSVPVQPEPAYEEFTPKKIDIDSLEMTEVVSQDSNEDESQNALNSLVFSSGIEVANE